MVKTPESTAYTKAVRRVYATAMHSTSLKKAMPDILRCIDAAIGIIEEQRTDGPVNLARLFTKMTLDIIGALAFETNLGGLDNSRRIHFLFYKIKETAMEAIKNPFLALCWKLFPWCTKARQLNIDGQRILEEYEGLIEEWRRRDDPPEGEEPIWHALLNLTDPETQKPIPFKTLLAEVSLVIFSGMETTAQQLEWILILLASSPRVTERLLEELKDHGLYGTERREVEFEELSDLTYLTAVIKEGMRISYTVAGIFLRIVPEDMTILGYRIPKGTIFNILGTCAYSTTAEWGDPDVFRPERWLTGEDMTDKYNLAFSCGPRDCAGQKLAMLEMRLVLVKLLTRYTFSLDDDWMSIFGTAKDVLLIEPRKPVAFQMYPRSASM